MQCSTPTDSVTGTVFEAAHILLPHPRIRPVAALSSERYGVPDSGTPKGDVGSKSSDTTVVDEIEMLRPYSSRMQYQVATSQVLGSLSRIDADILAVRHDATFSPVALRSMTDRAGSSLSPCLGEILNTSEDEKVHGLFCRTKSVVKSLRRSKKGGCSAGNLHGSFHSRYLSASTEQPIPHEAEEGYKESQASTLFDDPPEISPVALVSKFVPKLLTSILEIEFSSSIDVDYHSSKGRSKDKDADSHLENLRSTSLHQRSSNLVSRSQDKKDAGELPLCKLNEAVDGFFDSNETYQIHRPVSDFIVKRHVAMKSRNVYKPTFTAATEDPTLATPTSSPKLRHTAFQRITESHAVSRQSQFATSGSASSAPRFDLSKARSMDGAKTDKTVRGAPSVEEGLLAGSLKIYEEGALAAAAPIVRGVKPELVLIQSKAKVGETSAPED
ncbi:hypothetical protein SVAN01_01209 [Stagonosporopsis vannaccii]|nr:hypothetical protein SVAN01_01209 [Stagonosporopsis vannaccii]